MRSAVLLVAMCLALVQTPAGTAEESESPLTIQEVKRIIREQGPAAAAHTGLDDRWGDLLDAIATGEPAWLDIAAELGRHSDGEASETLAAAVGEALRRKPKRVLGRLDGNPFGARGVCGNGFADSGIRGATGAADYKALLDSQEAAVAGVGDAALESRRDTCLQLIRRRKAWSPVP